MAALRAFAGWIGDSIGHAFGNPREEHATLPPTWVFSHTATSHTTADPF